MRYLGCILAAMVLFGSPPSVRAGGENLVGSPPPVPAVGDRFSLSFSQVKLSTVLETLSRKTGVKLIAGVDLGEKPVSAYLEDVSGDEAIDAILQANGLFRERLGGSEVYVVYAGRSGESSQLVGECITLRHVRAQDLVKSLSGLGLDKSLAVDARTNSLVVKDTPQNIKQLRAMVTQLDVAHASTAVKTKIHKLQHAQAVDVWLMLPSILNRGSGEKTGGTKGTIEGMGTALPGQTGTAASGTSGGSSSSSGSSSGSSGSSGGSSSSGGGVSAGALDAKLSGLGTGTIQEKATLISEFGGGFSIVPDRRSNSIVIVGTDDFIKEVENVIVLLDQPVPQVSIEAVIVELSSNGERDLGIDWNVEASFAGAVKSVAYPWAKIPSGATGTATFTYGTFDFSSLTARLKFLETEGEANILANPRVTTLNDSPATIRITSTIPVSPIVTTTGGSQTTTAVQYDYKDIGITLMAIPHVTDGQNIVLEVEPKVVTAQQDLRFVDQYGNHPVDTYERSATTKVMVRSGQTLVIGGLLSSETTDSNSNVPFLGKVLPYLFSKKDKTIRKSDLVIFLMPKIVANENAAALLDEMKTKAGK